MNQFFYELLPLISFIFLIFLISLVVRSDWKSFTNRIFSFFLLAMGLWGFLIFGMRSSGDLDAALRWERLVMLAILFVGVFFYHFSRLITRSQDSRRLLILSYLLAALFVALAPTDLVVQGMKLMPTAMPPCSGSCFHCTSHPCTCRSF